MNSFVICHFISPRLPLVPRRAFPFFTRRKETKTRKGEEPTVPLLSTFPPEIVCAKKGNAVALLRPNQPVDCKRFCFAKANQEDLYDPLVYILR